MAFESAASKRQAIRTYVSESDWKTKSGGAILGELKELGLGIRRQDFLSLRRDVLNLYKFEEPIRRLRPETRVPRAWISEEPTWDIKTNLLYLMEVKSIDPRTGDEITNIRSFGSRRELSKQTTEAIMLAQSIEEDDTTPTPAESVELFRVIKKRGLSLP